LLHNWLFNIVDKFLPLSIKKTPKTFNKFIKHTIFNISEEKKKSTMFKKKSLFFLTREKSHILMYIFFRDLGMTFRDLRFRDLEI